MNRQTAFLVKVGELLEGRPAQQEAGVPSALFLPFRKLLVSRANIMGFVISKETGSSGYDEFVLDDGSGRIAVRNFDTSLSLSSLNIGDVVNVIGRVRDYNNTRYVIPEVLRKVDKTLLDLREIEIAAQQLPEEPEPVAKPPVQEAKPLDEGSPKQKVYEAIQEMDTGAGVEVQELKLKCKLKDIDKVVNTLIEDGEIFKVSSSRVKVL